MSLLSRLLRARPGLTDVALESAMAAAVEAAKVRHAVGDGEATWAPGEALRLLLVGYLGTRNTGADVRVAEMIRQFRAILGDEHTELTALTSDARLSAGYFPGVRQIKFPDVFPPFLYRETARHHGVVACEGSMFKSKFANALTTFMVGALGLAAAQNKLAIGYGAEAGDMDPLLQELVRRYCRDALIICRNDASRDVLAELDVPTDRGTDTAWTFEPAPPEVARRLLRARGWDGEQPVLIVCPINPFWWPVRPDLGKTLARRVFGGEQETHYRSLYYHDYGDADRARFDAYLDALAGGVRRFQREQPCFVALVGMERLDRTATERLAERLGDLGRPPQLVSDEHDMFELVAVLRQARYLVTSRYHAMVCSMPAGVPSLGVSMDERIENLLAEREQSELCLGVADPDLEDRLVEGLRTLHAHGELCAAKIRGSLPRQLELMGRMGMRFEDEVLRRYPEFPRRDVERRWENYLPPLPASLQDTLTLMV